MTKREVLKIAAANNVNTDRMNIYKKGGLIHIEMAKIPEELIRKNLDPEYNPNPYENIPEIDRLIRKYNRQAKRLVKVLGIGYCGWKAGSGEWFYREGGFTQSEELAFANMD